MGQRPWRGLVLALMLISLVTPVQADGEGIGMDAAQLPVSVDVDDSPLLSVHLVGFGVNGTAMLHASISDAEGSVVWSAMDNATLGGGDATVLVLNLSTVPTGVQQLELVLSGHVMASNTTHVSSSHGHASAGSAPVCRGGHGQFRSSGEPQRCRRPNWRLSS